MPASWTRRDFVAAGGTAALAALAAPGLGRAAPAATMQSAATARLPFRISLAQWSLHRTIRAGELDHLDFPRMTREAFGLDAVEYVNTFFMDRATDAGYLAEMNRRARDHGVYQHLIMCDSEGRLGDPDAAARTQAVHNHHKWVDAARELGCAMIRVNAASRGTWEEQAALAADGLRRLTEYAADRGLDVVVENHGGLSSSGRWLAEVMRRVDHPRCGTLPDFGNFRIADGEVYDRYTGVTELMPFAKAVSAKSHEFDADGNEVHTDYRRMLRIVAAAGYTGWIGIEYEGALLPERAGIAATKRLLETVRTEMMSS